MGYRFTTVQTIAIVINPALGSRSVNNFFVNQTVCIYLACSRMFLNDLVHDGLRCHRLICLVMTMPSVTNQIDYHVLVELHTIIQRHAGHSNHCIRIIGIHMEYRCFQHLGNIGAIQC